MKQVAYAIILILFIINTYSVYMTEHFNICITMLSVALIIYNLMNILVSRIKIKKIEVWKVVSYVAIFMLLFLAWHHTYIYGVYVLGILFPNIWLMIKIQRERNEVQEFLNAFVKISAIIAVCSLFFWIVGSTFRFLEPTNVVSFSWGHNIRYIKSYYGIYFEPQNASIDFGFLRFGVKNNSFFSEAPICAYVFIVAFTINENLEQQKRVVYRVLFLIMILSTLTTTSVVFVCTMTIYFITKIHTRNKYWTAIKRFMYVIITAFVIVIVISILQDKIVTYSGNIRLLKLQNEYKAFLNAPITGNGFNKYTNGSSNSITALLADGGILLWGIYYIPLIRLFMNKLKYKTIDYLLIAYIFVFAITVVQYTPLCVFIILLCGENLNMRR